jgi:hypothetical protein
MSSIDRLREILRGAATAPPRRELTYEPLGVDGNPVTPLRAWIDLPGARTLQTPYGDACVVERSAEGGCYHGSMRVDGCAGFDSEAIDTLRGRPLDAPAGERARPLFIDLETTGLSGGAGTVAFLVGLGQFDDSGAFQTRQFFLAGFAGERAMLHAVAEAIGGAPVVVTYNGGSFDLPIMETRWLFHRLDPMFESRAHLDMLPPARRLWRDGPDGDRSCRLVALEETLLGFVRTGDVPSAEIPTRYFEFIRTGDASPLEPVIEHNRFDLLSLAVLMARAQRLVREGPPASANARECVSLGRVYDRAGRLDEAEAAYRAAAEHPVTDRGAREGAWLALARLGRRRRRFAEAAEAWRQVVRIADRRGASRSEAIEALAIHHEHRERNLELARALAARALAQEPDSARQEAIRHRIARLERKLEKLRAEDSDLAVPVPSRLWELTERLDSEG